MSNTYFETLAAAARDLIEAEDAWQKTGADMPTTFAFLDAEEKLCTVVATAPATAGDGDTYAARLHRAARRSADADVCGRELSTSFNVKEAEEAFAALRALVDAS